MSVILTLTADEVPVVLRALQLYRRGQPRGVMAACPALVIATRLRAAADASTTTEQAGPVAGTALQGSGV